MRKDTTSETANEKKLKWKILPKYKKQNKFKNNYNGKTQKQTKRETL